MFTGGALARQGKVRGNDAACTGILHSGDVPVRLMCCPSGKVQGGAFLPASSVCAFLKERCLCDAEHTLF